MDSSDLTKLFNDSNASFHIIINAKIDGSTEIHMLDHISRNSCKFNEQDEEHKIHPFVLECKSLIERTKNAFRSIALFKK